MMEKNKEKSEQDRLKKLLKTEISSYSKIVIFK
jgi:hypothetical protein